MRKFFIQTVRKAHHNGGNSLGLNLLYGAMKKLVSLLLLCFLGVASAQTFPVQKSDAEWRKDLPEKAYRVLREGATETPFTGKHLEEKREGTFVCRGCGEPLFLSDTKYESRCGWPSFYAPKGQQAVLEKEDRSHDMLRTEILCAGCGGHLGHVFNDGPPPTGLRYCINSEALVFLKGK